MPTVSHVVKRYIADKPFLHEAIARDIISYGNLAENITPEIEKEIGKKIKHGAVVMALRRHAEELKDSFKYQKFDFSSEIVMKTNIGDISFAKTKELLKELPKISGQVDFDRGDILNIIYGNEEISIVTNDRHLPKIKKTMGGEEILHEEKGLVSLSLRFNEKFLHTPNVIFTILRELAWEHVNIIEIVSTYTELTLILNQDDAIRAYKVLQELVS